jgi:outer membrane receptor protein involved in Fe transport
MLRTSVRCLAAAILTAHGSAQAQLVADKPAPPATDAAALQSAPADTGTAAPGAARIPSIEVVARRLDEARNALSPDTGTTTYRFDTKDIAALPLGESTPLNQMLLQAPGVVQDSFGQLHVRGDHSNIQYRINGVVIPEAISGFGQALDVRFADQINFLTGALPAQYGYRTAGVVDLRTKGTAFENGARVGFLGGSHRDQEFSGELGGTLGSFTYYVTGVLLRNDLGIENPTPERNAIHDHTKQERSFGYFSYVINPDNRVSVVLGSSNNRFEIPNIPGQEPTFMLDGAPPLASTDLNQRQDEKNRFAVVSYQGASGPDLDYQLSLFHRYTDVHYQPDPIGDLTFNGVAAQILRKNEAYGLQADAGYRLNDTHTLRTGVFASRERATVDNTSQVFPADADGNQTSGVPLTIVDNSKLSGPLFGIYVQDEWRPLSALTVNYGIRFDHVKTVVDEQQWSPRIGLTWDVTQWMRVHAGYARYFTPPPTEKIDTTSVQKFVGTTNALPSDANTAISSERSHYFDAGLSYQLTPQLTVGLDGYYRLVKDLQDEGQFGNALIFSAFNYEKGRIRGIELTSSYRDGGLTAYANVGVSRAEGKNIVTGQFNFDPDELAFIAANWVHLDHDQTVAASAGMSYTWGMTTATVDAIYGSGLRRGFANTEHLPSYAQVNLGGSQKLDAPFIGKLELRLAVINVFDKVYELRDGSGIGVGAPQFGPRRAFYAGVAKPF